MILFYFLSIILRFSGLISSWFKTVIGSIYRFLSIFFFAKATESSLDEEDSSLSILSIEFAPLTG
jgi:hypothetical protein